MRVLCVFALLLLLFSTTASAWDGENAGAPASKSFIPDISLIMDAGYIGRSLDDEKFAEAYVPGFQEADHGHAADEAHSHGPGGRGFQLNYAELSLASSVDPLFDLVGIFHLSESSFEIEEIYAATRSLPAGFQIVAGKFYSSFGRINSQHSHVWDFIDRPIVYEMMFGPEALLDTGVHLNWLAPTDTYLRFGVEAFNGDNAEGSFARGGFSADIGGDERTIQKQDAPNAFVLFAKSSIDIGGLSLLGGVSYAFGSLRLDDGEEAVDAGSRVLGLDLLAKYYLSPYSYLAWQTEYLDRRIDGDQYFAEEGGEGYTGMESLTKEQAGIYSQLVFRLNQNLSVGGRYESLFKNDVGVGGVDQEFETDLVKWSLMAQWNFSEFSYARLQYNSDETKFIDGAREPVTEVIAQLNFLIGAHPAHMF